MKVLATDDLDIVTRRMEMLAVSTNRRATIDADLEKAFHELLAQHKTELGQLTRKIEFAEKVIFAIAEEHPEWFADEKTLKTPFGSINARAATSHKCADEEHTIRLIERAAERCEDAAQRERLLSLVRVKKEINLEAIERLDAKTLARLEVIRVKKTSLTIKLAKPVAEKKARAKTTKKEAPADVAAAA